MNRELKRTFALFLLVVAGICLHAQSPVPVEISYDAAGNRIIRKVLLLSKSSGSKGYGETEADKISYYTDWMKTVQIKIYPNPTFGKVYVDMCGFESNTQKTIHVLDSKGIMIYEKTCDEPMVEVDLSAFPAGYYIVELIADDERTGWKVIKN